MFKRILVPLDGSARAERAIPVAAQMARNGKGAVILLEVVNVRAGYGAPLAAPSPQPLLSYETDRVEAIGYLTELAARDDLAGANPETCVATGPVAQEILAAAQREHVDVVVLCSHGRTGFGRWALGSVAQKVARQSPVPVLVLRQEGPTPGSSDPHADRPLRLMVPLDGSLLAEAALEPAARLSAALAGPAGATLHLVSVRGVPPVEDREGAEADADGNPPASALEGARAYLGEIAERLRRGAPGGQATPVSWTVVFGPDVAEAIIGAAEGEPRTAGAPAEATCDVIAMATHGRGGMQRWVLGSVTERVLIGSRTPVLVVRPETAASTRAEQGEVADG
jgi:nucleotide-binding universal stress UspA family protein